MVSGNIGYIRILSAMEKKAQILGENISFYIEMNIYSLQTISHKNIYLIVLKNVKNLSAARYGVCNVSS